MQKIADGDTDLDEITVGEYLQLAMIHAMTNGIINIDQKVVHNGELYRLHMCMTQILPSDSMARALGETH